MERLLKLIKQVYYYFVDKINSAFFPVKRAYKRIKYIISWIPFLLDHDDFDSGNLLKLIQYQLNRIKKHIIEHNIIEDKEIKKISNEIDECLKPLSLLIQEEGSLCKQEWEKYDKKWGELEFWKKDIKDNNELVEIKFERSKVRTDKDRARSNKEALELYKLEQRREQLLEKQFMKLFLKYYKNWWC